MENKTQKHWMRKIILPIVITLVFAAVWFYITIPAINIKSSDFWTYVIIVVAVFFGVRYLLCKNLPKKKRKESQETTEVKIGGQVIKVNTSKKRFKRYLRIGGVVLGVAVVIVGAIWISSSEIFNAGDYHDQLSVETGNFQEDIAELPLSQIPVVDKEMAIKLGNRKLGEVVSLVSQFEISNMYTQINYQNSPTRVSPLEYSDIIKWFTNQSQGVPYYIKINMATQQTDLVELDQPMKYGDYEHFNRNLYRHIRFAYPTAMLDDAVFEIDESGAPFWVVPIYDFEIGFLGGRDITGIVLVDAVTGEMTHYDIDDVPQWIDNAYPADLLNIQADNWGKYSNGWFNSIFGQRDVITTTPGYTSLALNDDLWMYTGLTSVTGDQSNIGFILVNMRTKETKYYQINGADEESAMRSAEGKVQEKKYAATFPILINVSNYPTYFLSLKDEAGLIKQYAFVSVENYQIVGVGDSISAAQDSYVKQMQSSGANAANTSETIEVSGTIGTLASAVKDGNTNYYFTLTDNPSITYVASIEKSDELPMLTPGRSVSMTYTATDSNIRYVSTIDII